MAASHQGKTVFVCHAGESKPFVRQLVDRLKKDGLTKDEIFFDEMSLDPGDALDSIIKVIESPSLKLFVFVVSKYCFDSDRTWIRAEWEAAVENKRQIFPIWLDDNNDDFKAFGNLVRKFSYKLRKLIAERVNPQETATILPGLSGKICSLICGDDEPAKKSPLPSSSTDNAVQTTRQNIMPDVLPAKLKLEFVQKSYNQLLDKADALFDKEIFKDKKRFKKAEKLFDRYKATIESIIRGCFIFNLRFFQPCNVDEFYHDHFRLGPASLSAALTRLLVTDEMRAAAGGEELMVRVEVRYDDYIRVRRQLCMTGVLKATSMNNLSTLVRPCTDEMNHGHSSLHCLDLVITSTQDSSFRELVVHHPVTRQLANNVRRKTQQVSALERRLEMAKHQADIQESIVKSFQKEVSHLFKKDEEAQRVLVRKREEAHRLHETNRGLEAKIEKLMTATTKMAFPCPDEDAPSGTGKVSPQVTALEGRLEMAKHQAEIQEDIVKSLHKEVIYLKKKDEEAQRVLMTKTKEAHQLKETNRGLEATIEALHATKIKMPSIAPTGTLGIIKHSLSRENQLEILTLSNYQKELAEPAIQGKNTIVCAPTGSGKTYVAMYIIKQHLGKRLFFPSAQKRNVEKVMVLTPEITLLEQHYSSFCRYLSLFRIGKSSGSYVTKRTFEDIVESNDITVATPDILLNALHDKSVTITDFSLVVFDECHHTRKDHIYNKIMAEYLKIKRSDPRASLPQIVGLYASPGGKPNLSAAFQYLEGLITSFDAEVFKTVEKPENIKELEEKVNTPCKHVLIKGGSRPDDRLRDIVEGMMRTIEDLLPRHLRLQYFGPRGVQGYQSAVDLVRNQATEERKMDVVQQCGHLLNYNKALQINNTVRMKDAVKILTDFHDELKGSHRNSAAESQLLDLFEANRSRLLAISQMEETYPNPKLVELEKEILKAGEEFEDELKGILFVKTRALTQAMASWVRETPALRFLNPGILTGSSGEDVGRLTDGQQVGVIKKFNDGVHKLLITTSIAEECLDIRDCNMVIKYNYATNEIAMVQARGRARAAEGKELATAGLHIAEKDRVNALTVAISEKAIKNIQRQLHSGDLQQKVRTLQVQMIKDRKEKEN